MTDEPVVTTGVTYKDDDLVYVDPDTRTVVGPVEWSKTGNPKPMAVVQKEEPVAEKGKGGRPRSSRKTYPWGTYRSMKHVFHLEGKPKKHEPSGTLDVVIEKALKEPFWE